MVSRATEMFRNIVASKTISNGLIEVEANHNAHELAVEVRAEIEATIAMRVADYAITRIANEAGMPSHELFDFIRFLQSDPEIGSRYVAYKTARRLRGE